MPLDLKKASWRFGTLEATERGKIRVSGNCDRPPSIYSSGKTLALGVWQRAKAGSKFTQHRVLRENSNQERPTTSCVSSNKDQHLSQTCLSLCWCDGTFSLLVLEGGFSCTSKYASAQLLCRKAPVIRWRHTIRCFVHTCFRVAECYKSLQL